ncbi:MAG: DUF3473 domain-containing protein [Pirellulales bacterium]|nr:DUF3473 domain-containing protein [Pirellulales bacterium]
MTSPLSPDTPNALTVDVEDYFQVSAFAKRVHRDHWDRYDCRVEANTNRLLSIFDQANVRGTFFILGWVAERYPQLVKRVAAAGHEIASHGYWHQLVYDLSPEQFAEDIAASREAIHNACGCEVKAYRAPSFSIVPSSRWALDVLSEHGFTVDSSVFPIGGHDRYGDPTAPKSIHTIPTAHADITESPPPSGQLGKLPIPVGGGYFRLFPLRLTYRAIRQIRQTVGPAMFYTHPWEFDPDQPRIKGVGWKNRFRHCVGLGRTHSRLVRMLDQHPFDTLTGVIDKHVSFSSTMPNQESSQTVSSE